MGIAGRLKAKSTCQLASPAGDGYLRILPVVGVRIATFLVKTGIAALRRTANHSTGNDCPIACWHGSIANCPRISRDSEGVVALAIGCCREGAYAVGRRDDDTGHRRDGAGISKTVAVRLNPDPITKRGWRRREGKVHMPVALARGQGNHCVLAVVGVGVATLLVGTCAAALSRAANDGAGYYRTVSGGHGSSK